MSNAIRGNMVGSFSNLGKSLVITDESGTELTGIIVDEVTVFTADPKTDIREGTIAATNEGVVIGEAVIPNYETAFGKKIITAGSNFVLKLTTHNAYDYTGLQCIICPFNSSLSDSVAAEMVVIDDKIYNANSTSVVATLTKDIENKSVVFNLTNDSDTMYIIRFITYKILYGT